MILFTILLLVVVMLVITIALVVSAGGAIFITLFGDVIVCIVFIVLLIRWLIKRKRK